MQQNAQEENVGEIVSSQQHLVPGSDYSGGAQGKGGVKAPVNKAGAFLIRESETSKGKPGALLPPPCSREPPPMAFLLGVGWGSGEVPARRI